MRNGIIIFLIACLFFPFTGRAQEERVEEIRTEEITQQVTDTIAVLAPDSATTGVLTVADSDLAAMKPIKPAFRPDPNKALLMALVPGLGQIYNKAYWKLPIVYGAVLGCTYAITWNNRNYQDYRGAYIDIMSEHPEQNRRWEDFVPGNITDEQEKLAWAQNNKDNMFRSRRDYFRRYRDLSVIISVGVYLISVLDAYVDAQLFDFDISPDLTMRVEPTVTPRTQYTPHTYGVNCSIKF